MSPRVALIGCGRWGRNIGRCLHRLGVLAAVGDASPAAAQLLAEAHEVPAMTPSQVLADPAIDAVAIATPAVTHAELSLAAMDAGKHVFVEKPMAMSVADAEQVAARAETTGRTLMVGHLLQYHPAFITLRAEVGAGLIGPLRYVYSNRLAFGQIRIEENSLWSFAPHDLSMILSLMGEAPESVSATGAAYVQPHLPDVTTTHLSFSGGRRGHVFVSWLHPYKEQRLVVVGERGMIEFNDSHDWPQKLRLYRHQVDWQQQVPTAQKADAEPIDVSPAEPLLEEMRHFLDCMASGEQPRTHAQEGIAVLKVLNAAQAELDVLSSTAASASGRV